VGDVSESGDTNGQGPEVPTHAEARDAALDAVEPHRLLEGEDENTAFPEDAVHWAKVYGELLDFKRSLLTLAEERTATMDADAEAEVEETDRKLLLAEAARFERRLDFWQERVTYLRGASGTSPP
jgi:hypothetical protein